MATTPKRWRDRALFRHDLIDLLLDWYGSGRTIVKAEELADALGTEPREMWTTMGRLERVGPLSASRPPDVRLDRRDQPRRPSRLLIAVQTRAPATMLLSTPTS